MERSMAMTTILTGVLEIREIRLISRRAMRFGFRGQDLDEVVQETAIRLCRTEVRDAALIVAATHESMADICRRESRHQKRLERLSELAPKDRTDSADEATAQAIDVWDCVQELSQADQLVCKYLSRGYTIREIAEAMHISPTAVQLHKARIRAHLLAHDLGGRPRETPS
jgi:RNA polymerase sigma factor (sigma-70 family)